jgi:hypothetical protein
LILPTVHKTSNTWTTIPVIPPTKSKRINGKCRNGRRVRKEDEE